MSALTLTRVGVAALVAVGASTLGAPAVGAPAAKASAAKVSAASVSRTGVSRTGVSAPSEHDEAMAVLHDIRAAIAAVLAAENGTSSGPADYITAAHSAVDALVGRNDPAFDARSPDPGDARGALGQVNDLLDHEATPPFVPALHGVQINLLAAVASLQDALKARSLDGFQENASDALENLEIAQGRSSQYDVLGGIAGAIANTRLGVPDDARIADGCAAPHRPGFGVSHGWLAWRAMKPGPTPVATGGYASVKMENDMMILYTTAAPMVQQHCTRHADAKAAAPPALIKAAVPAATTPLYTTAQAARGKAVYAANCASCHGTNLQGVAAPAIAGSAFLKTATINKYTVSILDTIVTQNMPFNNPASLKPDQYADVMAYLLASNCYPAGKMAFPSDPKPGFGTAIVGVQAHPAGTPDAKGVCPVK